MSDATAAPSVTPSESVSQVAPSHASSRGSRRGGRGRGGRGLIHGQRGALSIVGSGIARPQHLSTTSSIPRDDPILIDDFTISGADSLTPISFIPTVALDHQGYPDLCRAVYQQISLVDRSLSSRLPMPLFLLYCNSALWYRYLALSVAFGRREVDNVVYIEQFRSIRWFLPDPIKRYLDGIGEFRTFTGDKFQPLSPPMWPIDTGNYPGSYGKVTDVTSPLYTSYPSPFVAVYNVLATIARSSGYAWGGDLPSALKPATVSEGTWKVTENLSGFDLSGTLGSKQISVLTNLGFTVNPSGYRFSHDRFGFNGPTLSYVSSALELMSGYKITEFSNSIASGSLALTPYLEIDAPISADYRESYLSGPHKFEVKSSTNLDSRLSSGSLLMSYRIKRHLFEDGRCNALPYTLVDKDDALVPVPSSYSISLNSNYNRGTSNRLNVELYNSNPVSRRDVLPEMTRAFIKA